MKFKYSHTGVKVIFGFQDYSIYARGEEIVVTMKRPIVGLTMYPYIIILATLFDSSGLSILFSKVEFYNADELLNSSIASIVSLLILYLFRVLILMIDKHNLLTTEHIYFTIDYKRAVYAVPVDEIEKVYHFASSAGHGVSVELFLKLKVEITMVH